MVKKLHEAQIQEAMEKGVGWELGRSGRDTEIQGVESRPGKVHTMEFCNGRLDDKGPR